MGLGYPQNELVQYWCVLQRHSYKHSFCQRFELPSLIESCKGEKKNEACFQPKGNNPQLHFPSRPIPCYITFLWLHAETRRIILKTTKPAICFQTRHQ